MVESEVSAMWSKLAESRTGVADSTLTELLTTYFPQGAQVYLASQEPMEYKVLVKVDPKLTSFLTVNGIPYSQSPEIDQLNKDGKKSKRAFNVVLMTFASKGTDVVNGSEEAKLGGYRFMYVEADNGETRLIFYNKEAPIVAFVKELRKVYRAMTRSSPSIMVMGGEDVPFSIIKKLPYVPPQSVEGAWSQHIDPQLRRKRTWNHVIFYGPPGTGKTAFCRWIATQYPGWKFMFISPYTVQEAGRISTIFRDARKYAPAVVVFEDIDLVARNRGMESEAFSPLLGELLNVLDGVNPKDNVLAIATTNNISSLDPAIIRNGRFGVRMELTYTPEEKVKILRGYYNIPLSDEEIATCLNKVTTPVDLKMIAKFVEIAVVDEQQTLTESLLAKIIKEVQSAQKTGYVSEDEMPRKRGFRGTTMLSTKFTSSPDD